MVLRRREDDHTSYRPLLNMQANDARPEQSHRVITSEMIAEVNASVLDNRRITMDEIHRLLGISVDTTHAIMHQHLNIRNICAQWVPNQLTTEQRNTRIALSLSHLQRYHEKEYGFLSQIVTGNETWGSSKTVHTSSGKVMMSFFHSKGIRPIEFLERGTTINVQRYQSTLQNLRRAIKSKCLGMLSNGVIFLHDKCANSFGDYF
ncbi:histone-lysine N-methyltransferase SETMAR [Trichonephila clavipes]|nr:histone-lysine N-methyltransferase SETMAR [Trichonephila clavipes]